LRAVEAEITMRRFWSDRSGNIAVLFAFGIVPVIGAVGAAVDYSMASSHRADMQKALDATALALSKILPMDQALLNEVGMSYFLASLGKHTLSNVGLEITPVLGKVTLQATGTYTPKLANVFGAQAFQIGASAEAIWGIGKVEVVLALDNTGSMAGEKITKLKKGAQKLVDILKNAVREPGDAKIGIVPYTVQVRVDPAAHAAATWWRDGYCSKSQYKNEDDCEDEDGTWRQTNSANWTGCIADRDRKDDDNDSINHDVKDTEPTANPDTKFPRAPANANRCPTATILPLTDVYEQAGYDAITGKIATMQAVGNTNVTIGAAWGWHLLDDKAPFTEGRPYNTKDVQKYLILMTDGMNTESRFSSSQNAIDDRTEAVCANIKALPQNTANNPPTPAIKVWSIRLMNGNQALLKKCATNDSMYMNVTDPDQLEGVFGAIGTEIASLHLSK
jgi:Flp pilus assembly protein TadG